MEFDSYDERLMESTMRDWTKGKDVKRYSDNQIVNIMTRIYKIRRIFDI
jgi:hypothetical protein